MGGVGERRRRARTRHARHVSRRRLFPSWRQHPADARRGAEHGAQRRATCCAASRPATRSRSTSCARSACTSTRSTTSRISARRRRPASARCSHLHAETIYQAVQQAVHVSFTTRQSRKGEICSWKAYAPAHAGKLAIEAVDRAMRGEGAPSPIYEGEDSVIAWMLDGRQGALPACRCPRPASPSAPSWTATRRSTPPNTRARR